MKSKSLKLVFVLDPLEKLYFSEDTSCTVMAKSIERGHAVYGLQMGRIFAKGSSVFAHVQRLNVSLSEGIKVLEEIEDFNLSESDVIFIRKEPPFDSEYLYLTQLLDIIEKETFILNSPSGLRTTNEKLAILEFPEFIPETCVSADSKVLKSFAEDVKTVIVKPLNQKGGDGIERISAKDTRLNKKLNSLTENGTKTVMAQRYLADVEKSGDVRVLLLGGDILGTFCRIPLKGHFLANMDRGGRAAKHTLSRREREISQTIARRLLAKGHHFVGIDIIGECLTEINVTSPAGIFEITQLEGTDLVSRVVDYLERQADVIARRSSKQSRSKLSTARRLLRPYGARNDN